MSSSDAGRSSPAPPILVVMGVSGCGKSTLAAYLAGRLGWDLAEGDDLHPAANVRKMYAGHPLTDADRAPWLDRIAAWIDRHAQEGRPGVITCSALKRRYRDVLRRGQVIFVHPAGPRELIAARLHGRLDHFMPESLLDSQYADLEPLGPDESGLTVDLDTEPKDQAAEVVTRLGLRPAGAPNGRVAGAGAADRSAGGSHPGNAPTGRPAQPGAASPAKNSSNTTQRKA